MNVEDKVRELISKLEWEVKPRKASRREWAMGGDSQKEGMRESQNV